MPNEPFVSVVIATYNMGQYLPDAVKSILAQSWRNFEIIIVDDGSTDDTEERIRELSDDPRVRYIPTENRGQPKAKNRGLAEAKGDFIAFCDADDLWSPDKLTVQMPHFENEAVGVVYSEVSYIDQDGHPISKEIPYPRHSGTVTEHLVIKNFVPFGTAVIRRACLDRNGMFDEALPMGIDWDLWLRYSVDWQFQYAPEVTYIYRIWPGQMSNNYRGRYDNAFRILNKFVESNPGVIPKKLKARAWADMYVSRGMHIANAENAFIEPCRDMFKALRCNLLCLEAWKSLIKICLNILKLPKN